MGGDCRIGSYRCPICGKLVYPRVVEEWAYQAVIREKKYLYCSWTCFRAGKSAHRKARNKQKRPVRCVQTGQVWPSITDAAKELGVDAGRVGQAAKTGKPLCCQLAYETIGEDIRLEYAE